MTCGAPLATVKRSPFGLDVRLGPFRDRIERPERAHGVGFAISARGLGGEDGRVDRVGASRREASAAASIRSVGVAPRAG